MQSIFCNNCGDRGHAFRECKKPVLSCGILLLKDRNRSAEPTVLPIEKQDIELLMILRKYSMSFTEFMRGKYDVNDTAYIQRLLENMTQHELEELNTVPFDVIWSKLWSNLDRIEHELPSSRDKFEKVSHLISESRSVFVEPEWGFPKGRRYRCETDIQCAEREFFEETNIPRSAYMLVKDVEFVETFVGTNGIPYQHKYFLAVTVQPQQTNTAQRFTPAQRREISAIAWKNIEECGKLTRPHYVERDQLIDNLVSFVNSVEVRIPNFLSEDNGNTGTRFAT